MPAPADGVAAPLAGDVLLGLDKGALPADESLEGMAFDDESFAEGMLLLDGEPLVEGMVLLDGEPLAEGMVLLDDEPLAEGTVLDGEPLVEGDELPYELPLMPEPLVGVLMPWLEGLVLVGWLPDDWPVAPVSPQPPRAARVTTVRPKVKVRIVMEMSLSGCSSVGPQ